MIYLQLFLEFFLIGLFTFGGGYAMIPLIKQIVIKNLWLTEDLFIDFLAVAESTPGPIAINMATFVGATQGGPFGSIVATIGVVLPAFLIIILIAALLKHLLDNPYVQAFLKGIKPVIFGLILATGIVLFMKSIGFTGFTSFDFKYQTLVISILLITLFVGYKLYFKKKMNSILFILLAASIGITTFLYFNLLS